MNTENTDYDTFVNMCDDFNWKYEEYPSIGTLVVQPKTNNNTKWFVEFNCDMCEYNFLSITSDNL